MTKELRELMENLEEVKQETRKLLESDKTEEAREKANELRTIQSKIEIRRQLDASDDFKMDSKEVTSGSAEPRDRVELEKEYRSIFLRGMRRNKITSEMRSTIGEYEKRVLMNEGGTVPAIPDGDSSLLVPRDIQTRINEIRRSLNDLSQLVRVETVSTLSGTRVLEKDEDMTPFEQIDEYQAIPEMDNPKFIPLSYSVKKRAGFLPLTNDLLKDTDENLIQYVTRWIGKKAVVTRNKLITDILKSLPPREMADLKALKKVLNVDLNPAISLSARILTNQDGFNWLDCQQDTTGRFLLQDDISAPGKKLLFGRPVEVVANRFAPSDEDKAPIWIGDFREAVVLFSREFFELTSSTEGGDAWRRDTTEMRTIMRDDIQKWDEKALVYGTLALK